jgi:recombination protein RecA
MTPKAKSKDIDQLLKEGSLLAGDDDRLQLHRLPTGILPLDTILGGGFPRGRLTMLVGPESTGKTLLAQYAAAAQQKDEELPDVLLVDAELSYDKSWWEASGVDVSKLLVTQPTTAETAIDLIVAVMEADKKLGMIIIDSIAALTPAPILERSAEDKTIGLRAQVINLLLGKVVAVNRQAVIIVVNQMRENIGGHEEVYPGGHGLRHWSHIILRTRREGWIKDGETRIGFTLEALCRKNKTAPPLGVCQIPFRFRGQIDFLQTYIDEGIERGIITDRSPYYDMPESLGGGKFLGRNNLRQHLLEHPDVLEILKEMVQTKGKE